MRNEELDKHAANKDMDRAPYEPPAIIYEGLITTRAATLDNTGGGGSPGAGTGANPADIFSSDG